jgi:hypothetical protein
MNISITVRSQPPPTIGHRVLQNTTGGGELPLQLWGAAEEAGVLATGRALTVEASAHHTDASENNARYGAPFSFAACPLIWCGNSQTRHR